MRPRRGRGNPRTGFTPRCRLAVLVLGTETPSLCGGLEPFPRWQVPQSPRCLCSSVLPAARAGTALPRGRTPALLPSAPGAVGADPGERRAAGQEPPRGRCAHHFTCSPQLPPAKPGPFFLAVRPLPRSSRARPVRSRLRGAPRRFRGRAVPPTGSGTAASWGKMLERVQVLGAAGSDYANEATRFNGIPRFSVKFNYLPPSPSLCLSLIKLKQTTPSRAFVTGILSETN